MINRVTKLSAWAIVLCVALATRPCSADSAMATDADTEVKVILVPYREIVISSKVSTTVKEYKVKEGQTVKKDQPLLVLDDKYYLQKFNNSKAALKQATTSKDFTESDYKFKVQLFQRGVYGKMELKESKFNAEMAKSKLDQLQAQHQMNEYDLKSCEVVAPFDGRVVKKIARVYEYVLAGDPVLKIINDRKLYAVMHFPSNQITKIKNGQKLKIRISETGKDYEVAVEEVSADIDPRSRTFEVKAVLDNSKGNLRAGMSGYLVK